MLIYSIELPLPSGLEVKQILELACKWIYGSKHNKLKKGNFEDILTPKISRIRFV